MTSCTAYPLAASADTAPCSTTAARDPPQWPRCCETMATPFSRCCGCCTGGEAVVLTVLAYVSAELTFRAKCWVCTGGCVLYLALHMSQCKRRAAGMQVMQGTICIAVTIIAASHPDSVLAIWFTMVAAVVHIFFAVVLYEIMRLGDCRTCLQEAHTCDCGPHKDPIPPGSLYALQISLARNFRLQRSLN